MPSAYWLPLVGFVAGIFFTPLRMEVDEFV